MVIKSVAHRFDNLQYNYRLRKNTEELAESKRETIESLPNSEIEVRDPSPTATKKEQFLYLKLAVGQR